MKLRDATQIDARPCGSQTNSRENLSLSSLLFTYIHIYTYVCVHEKVAGYVLPPLLLLLRTPICSSLMFTYYTYMQAQTRTHPPLSKAIRLRYLFNTCFSFLTDICVYVNMFFDLHTYDADGFGTDRRRSRHTCSG